MSATSSGLGTELSLVNTVVDRLAARIMCLGVFSPTFFVSYLQAHMRRKEKCTYGTPHHLKASQISLLEQKFISACYDAPISLLAFH